MTSPEGALRTAEKANTYNQRAQAMKNLEAAIKNLDKNDKDYGKTLDQLTNKYKTLKNQQDQVTASMGQMQQRQSNLMDISGQLMRRLALVFSVSQVTQYVQKLAQVRGEFELQNAALAAIMQNKDQADQLFGQITQLAVQSRFNLRELVTYTKELAAYRIENEKLYDTTKMLADVSAGLGVDMSRLILAYGQVKAANFLRGCLGYNTPVMLYDGSIKKVQDVVVGDILINEKGEPVNVLELIRGRETMFLVEQVSGHNRTSYRVNRNHILTLWNVREQRLEDVYVYDYLKNKDAYLGLKIVDGEKVYYDIEVTKDRIDDYYGFILDGNKRFRLGDGTITHNTELRQFSEAGINILGELATYFTEIENRAVSVGTPIYAPADGLIVWAANPADTSGGYLGNWEGYPYGAGNNVAMLVRVNDTTYFVSFSHMAQEGMTVSAGDSVSQGDVIGLTGNSGNSSGAHCHIEIITLGSMSISEAASQFASSADFAWGCGWSSPSTGCDSKGSTPCRERPETLIG